MRASTLSAVAIATGVGLAWPHAAVAQEYCVACAEPKAIYRCVIGDARLAGGQPLQSFCTTTLAREGGHQNCQIKPGTVFDCDGPIKRLATGPAQNAPAPGSEKKPPATVDRLTRDMARSSGEQAEKTSEAIGGGARKAWGCVLSFFTSC
jgi:hypothetical protein